MPTHRRKALAACLLLVPVTALAQPTDPADEAAEPAPWTNAAELSVVRTSGNSETQTFGFRNTLRRNWTSVRLRARFEGVRSRTGGERILQVEPGLRFRPGARPDSFETQVDHRGGTSGVEQYFVEGRVEWPVSERFFWNAGTSWNRNDEAGIRNRYVTFGGVGNVWAAGDEMSLSTSYGFSHTAGEDTEPDAARDTRFGGVRADGDYHHRIGDAVELDGDAVLNVRLLSLSDYSLNVTNAVGVAMSEHLSLRVSVQYLFEHDPALEDADLIARVALIDPDGTPGSGDELFQTLAAGGAALDFGAGRIRKRGLDIVVRTALVINF